ncbi:MAG: polyphosphate polymerase domain-containing protein [Clostridia bacterium]|nr:polyphosphate polymerase domain-containing protein [Clostridia bacterium]
MADIYIFKRIEKKYRLTDEKKALLMSRISDRLIPDVHGVSTVCNLYLDTPSFLLIRNSIDAVSYKEKLRIRSYGVPTADSKVFFEIKKKLKGVVYKRRISMKRDTALDYVKSGVKPVTGQIMDEIDWAMRYYENPMPRVALFYEREAFTVRDEDALRITFDTGVRYRTDELCDPHDSRGKTIIPDDVTIMEIKTGGAMPLWLSHILDEIQIFPSKFSKYGTAYHDMLSGEPIKNEGVHNHA